MFKQHILSRLVWSGAAVLGALTFAAQPALAGECPADKVKPNAQQMVDYKPVGVTDVTLGAIVPWHSHDDRPALIFVQQGEIVEYASNCVDPIVHKAGDIRPEVFGTSHWWKNLGKETVVLYVGDVRRDPNDHHM